MEGRFVPACLTLENGKIAGISQETEATQIMGTEGLSRDLLMCTAMGRMGLIQTMRIRPACACGQRRLSQMV